MGFPHRGQVGARSGLIRLLPELGTRPVEAFGEAAMLDEVALQFLKLAPEEISRLVDQANERVGSHFRGGFSDAVRIVLVGTI